MQEPAAITAPPTSAPPAPASTSTLELSIVIPALNEAGNIGELATRCRATLARMGLLGEVLVIDGGSRDGTVAEAEAAGARVVMQRGRGYGGALRTGFAEARGAWIQTMDSDLSHEPEVIERLWAAREANDVTIASRYVPGGAADMSPFRRVLSLILNFVFARAMRIVRPDGSLVKDVSSGFRLYRREVVASMPLDADDFDVLEEILIRALIDGRTLGEAPFHYRPRKEGRSHAKLFKFGVAYLRTLRRMRRLRRAGRAG